MKKNFCCFLIAVVGLFTLASVVRAQEEKGSFADWGGGEVLAAMVIGPTPLPRIVTEKDVNFNETVNQDLMVAGGDVDLNSRVDGDVFVAGGNIVIDGEIEGDLIVVGGQVILRGDVAGKVIAGGGELVIDEGTVIGGYLLAVGGKIELAGKTEGDVRLAGGEVTIQPGGVMSGDLMVDAGEITVSTEAVVRGTKKINLFDNKERGAVGNSAAKAVTGVTAFFKLVGLMGKIILILVLVKVFGKQVTPITKLVSKSFWPTMVWGFAKLFLTPVLIIILLMTIIGWPVAMLVTFVYIVALFLSGYISAAAFGHFAHTKGWLRTNNLYAQAGLGLLMIELVGLIPFVGWLVRFSALLVGLGVIVHGEKQFVSASRK